MASSKDNAPVPASLVIDKTRCLNGSQIGAALAEVSFPTIHWHEGARVASASAPLLVSAFRWRSVGPFLRNATSQKSPGYWGFCCLGSPNPTALHTAASGQFHASARFSPADVLSGELTARRQGSSQTVHYRTEVSQASACAALAKEGALVANARGAKGVAAGRFWKDIAASS
jgi:hypothetical protein